MLQLAESSDEGSAAASDVVALARHAKAKRPVARQRRMSSQVAGPRESTSFAHPGSPNNCEHPSKKVRLVPKDTAASSISSDPGRDQYAANLKSNNSPTATRVNASSPLTEVVPGSRGHSSHGGRSHSASLSEVMNSCFHNNDVTFAAPSPPSDTRIAQKARGARQSHETRIQNLERELRDARNERICDKNDLRELQDRIKALTESHEQEVGRVWARVEEVETLLVKAQQQLLDATRASSVTPNPNQTIPIFQQAVGHQDTQVCGYTLLCLTRHLPDIPDT